mgnify:CR=1 FL=1
MVSKNNQTTPLRRRRSIVGYFCIFRPKFLHYYTNNLHLFFSTRTFFAIFFFRFRYIFPTIFAFPRQNFWIFSTKIFWIFSTKIFGFFPPKFLDFLHLFFFYAKCFAIFSTMKIFQKTFASSLNLTFIFRKKSSMIIYILP